MLAPSSPIAFPPSSSPVNQKRSRQHDAAKPPKPRATGGFIDDDSDDDGENNEPLPKRRMLERDTSPSKPPTDLPDADIAESRDEPTKGGITTPPDSQPNEDLQEEAERYSRLFGLPQNTLSQDPTDNGISPECYRLSTCSGRSFTIRERKPTEVVSYDKMAAARSRTKEGRAVRSYYGIDIHQLVDSARKELADQGKDAEVAAGAPPQPQKVVPSVEDRTTNLKKQKKSLLWTEKYRARSFLDLVGDDLTNRQVLRWLKRWDPLVFPNAAKTRPSVTRRHGGQQQTEEEKPHRKILLLTGPPGLGKTTLAHVCARQAGYEVLEINASDDRSRDVVKGRIRTSLGTESVKTVEHRKPEEGKQAKIARPLCVVVDEVDGVVTGSGASGEGGFVKALIDLVLLDQANSAGDEANAARRRKKKADDFRQMRPLILICNDVYHPSLRPLRQSGLAEIIHVGKPPMDTVVTRLKSVFEKEGIQCDKDAARRLCEAAWGMSTTETKRRAESNAEGDLRGVMVVGEWVAGRLKAASQSSALCLTRQWVDRNILQDLSHGGGGARGLGRGGVKEIVTRIFQEGAGFPAPIIVTTQSKHDRHEQPQMQLSFGEQQKKYAMTRLREMIETSGETDKIMAEIFSEYPNRDYNDDSYLTKPDAAYEWMSFHDTCSSRLFASQEWELAPYISQPALACHHLFASPRQPRVTAGYDKKWGETDEDAAPPVPFSGPRADYEAHEAEKVNRATLQAIQSQLPATLMRAFRSPEHVATDFLPYLIRLVSPDVKPVVIGGSDKTASVASVRRESEKAMVRRAAETLADVGISLQKGKIEDPTAGPGARPQWVYRMEP